MKRILITLAALITVAGATAQEVPQWVRRNAISPDAKTIAFSYKGDIYTVPSEGGLALQITSNKAYETDPIWTPDGSRIVFSSWREGSKDIFVTSERGGTPTRLTTMPGSETPLAVSPDGYVYYNWYTATAGNGTISTEANTNVTGDICPAGWRLPTGGTGGEYANLVNSVGGATASVANERLLSFPNNFIYSGDYNYNTSGGRGTFGRYWSATPNNTDKAYRLGVAIKDGATPLKSWDKWDAFAVRCILK